MVWEWDILVVIQVAVGNIYIYVVYSLFTLASGKYPSRLATNIRCNLNGLQYLKRWGSQKENSLPTINFQGLFFVQSINLFSQLTGPIWPTHRTIWPTHRTYHFGELTATLTMTSPFRTRRLRNFDLEPLEYCEKRVFFQLKNPSNGAVFKMWLSYWKYGKNLSWLLC